MAKTIGIDTWQEFDKKFLALQGKLYPYDMQFEICAPTVVQIRKWHSMDDSSPLALANNIIEMIKGCVRVVKVEGKNYNVKDIYEHDKLAFLIAIFDKFNADNEMERNLFVKGDCANQDCKEHYDKLIVRASNLTYKQPDEKLMKYWNDEESCFIVKTKSFEDIRFKPSTLGLAKVITDWTQSLDDANWVTNNIDTVLEIQSLFTDWRGLNPGKVRKAQIEIYNMMPDKRKLMQMQILDNFNVSLQGEVEFICGKCKQPFRCGLPTDQLNRDMFTPVQSFMDELL